MSGKVYDQIRDDIMAGDLAPGAALAELAMADRYGTSRTPIREALRRLEQDGLVERAERGMRVRVRSPEEILEIYDVRVSLEATAARWAATRRTEFDLACLRSAHDRMLAVEPTDAPQMAETNRRFHETLWVASHNGALIDVLRHLSAHLTRYPETTLTQGDRWAAVLEEHARIVTAIEEGDAVAANAMAEEHMTGARDIRLRMASGAIE